MQNSQHAKYYNSTSQWYQSRYFYNKFCRPIPQDAPYEIGSCLIGMPQSQTSVCKNILRKAAGVMVTCNIHIKD